LPPLIRSLRRAGAKAIKTRVTIVLRIVALAISCGLLGCAQQRIQPVLPSRDISFLRDITRDVIEASRVKPNSNGGGNCLVTNTCGFTLITPGKDTYQAFWPRDFSMALGTGFITTEEIRNHLHLLCRVQNNDRELRLANDLHVPPWAIPDHVNYDGRPVWFPGAMSSGMDQGSGLFGRMPPLDDNYEFIHIAFVLWQKTHDEKFLRESINGSPVIHRLQRAFAMPKLDNATGLVETTERDRAVGFGFCDAEAHTGKLLFASLLRYRAANELAKLCRALKIDNSEYREAQKLICANVGKIFCDPAIGGWLRASTELSKQPDVWGTLYALELGVLDKKTANAARKTIVRAWQTGTITFEGGVRHVPTNMDFSPTSAWERSVSPLNTYQNGGYWHTATGWLMDVLGKEDRNAALNVFNAMIAHLREGDFRKGPGHNAPWEVFGPNDAARRNPVYMASVAVPYSILLKQ
jgi:hypothetical protein